MKPHLEGICDLVSPPVVSESLAGETSIQMIRVVEKVEKKGESVLGLKLAKGLNNMVTLDRIDGISLKPFEENLLHFISANSCDGIRSGVADIR